jgi:lysophospholipase L1-like esterase
MPTTTFQLTAFLADGGTVTFAYPAGTSAASFATTSGHVLKDRGTKWFSPREFTVVFGVSNITVTYNGGETIPKGTVLTLDLDAVEDQGDAIKIDLNDGAGPVALDTRLLEIKRGYKFPAGARLAVLGSSTVARNNSVSGTPPVFSAGGAAGGLMVSLRARDPRMDFSTVYDTTDARNFRGSNYGFNGTAIPAQAEYVDEIIAKGYKAVVLANMGQNDVATATPISTVLANLRGVAQQFLGAGLVVFLNTINPRAIAANSASGTSDLLAGDAYWRRRVEFNEGVAALAQELSCELIDTRPTLEDASSPIRQAKTGVSADGLHLTGLGAWLWAEAAAPVFARVIAPGSHHVLSASAAGNLYANPGLTGTSGFHSFNSTGDVPTNMRLGRLTSGAGTLSGVSAIVTDPEEGNAVRSTMTLSSANPASDVFRWMFSNNSGAGDQANTVSGMAGKWARGFARVYVESGIANIVSIRLVSDARTSHANTGNLVTTVEAVNGADKNGTALWLVTEPFLCPTGTTHISLKAEIVFTGTGTVIVEVSRPAIREVPAPVV